MKTAHCHYHFANRDHHLYTYFDPKAFEGILPSLNLHEQDQFIYQICDSLALALAKNTEEKHIFIKKAYRIPDNTLLLCCTDGFLIDPMLTLPIHEQPFQAERIHITQTEIYSKWRLSYEQLQSLQNSLAIFEEEHKKRLNSIRPMQSKEKITLKKISEKSAHVINESASFFAELNPIKKELMAIAQNRLEILSALQEKMDHVEHQFNQILLQESLLQDKNTKEYAETLIQEQCKEFTEIAKSLLIKTKEISTVPETFNEALETAINLINQNLNEIHQFKLMLIDTLYEAAKASRALLEPPFKEKSANQKKLIIHEFNRKFGPFAYLNPEFQLSSLEEARDQLSPYDLEKLQNMISNEDKESLGLIQKCNTSWIEESNELKIVIKQLTNLQSPFFNLSRVPFPRGYQFKLTEKMYFLLQSINELRQSQKLQLKKLAQSLKKNMIIEETISQTDGLLKKTDDTIRSIHQSLENHQSVLFFKEEAKRILGVANQIYAQTQHLQTWVQPYKKMGLQMNTAFKIAKKKVEDYLQKITDLSKQANQYLREITELNIEIEITLQEYEKIDNHSMFSKTVEEYLHAMKEKVTQINEINNVMELVFNILQNYQEMITLSQSIDAPDANTILKKYHSAKNFILHLLKQQMRDGSYGIDTQKKLLVELYTKIDNGIQQMYQEKMRAKQLKNQLWDALNNRKSNLSEKEFKSRVEHLRDQIGRMTLIAKEVEKYMEQLKNSFLTESILLERANI